MPCKQLTAIFCILTFSLALTGCGKSQAANSQDEISQLRSEVARLTAANNKLILANGELAKDRDTCQSRFNRTTLLYDGTLLRHERWIIPADITPKIVGEQGLAAFTHYDPTTQTETVKMAPIEAK